MHRGAKGISACCCELQQVDCRRSTSLTSALAPACRPRYVPAWKTGLPPVCLTAGVHWMRCTALAAAASCIQAPAVQMHRKVPHGSSSAHVFPTRPLPPLLWSLFATHPTMCLIAQCVGCVALHRQQQLALKQALAAAMQHNVPWQQLSACVGPFAPPPQHPCAVFISPTHQCA